MRVRIVVLVALTLLVQRLLGGPGMPGWLVQLMVPMVWLVVPAMLRHEHRWPYYALALGLAWDLLIDEIIGPGGIAWSAGALLCNWLSGVIADRSPRAWAMFGAVGAAVVALVRQLALLPLGQAQPILWTGFLCSLLLTGAWCGLVGWVLQLDLPSRWLRYRARRLR